MKSILSLCIAAFIFTYMQIEVHTFSSPQSCIDNVVMLVKEKRSELSTEYLLSNRQASESLQGMCKYYVGHKVHKVLSLVDKDVCATGIASNELDESIYKSYVQLLDQLKIYEGREIPNSFGQLNDHITSTTNAFFDMTRDRVAGYCLHTSSDTIE